VPARVVMEILGHSQIALTMNTYSHVMPALTRDAADRMNAVFAPPAPAKAVGDQAD
jgi:integrase